MSDSTERFGELLLKLGTLTQQQTDDILKHQKEHPDMLFGHVGIHPGYITGDLLKEYL